MSAIAKFDLNQTTSFCDPLSFMHDRGRSRNRFRSNPLRRHAAVSNGRNDLDSLVPPRKDQPGRGHRYPLFLGLHRRDCSVRDAHLLRDGCHILRCDGYIIWSGDGVALGIIAAGDGPRWSSFLHWANGVAMVALAQTANPSNRDTALKRSGLRRISPRCRSF